MNQLILAGLELEPYERQLIQAHLDGLVAENLFEYKTLEQFEPGLVASRSAWISEIQWSGLEELLDWGFPVMVCARRTIRDDSLRRLYNMGAGAVFFPQRPFLFPEFSLERMGNAMLIMDDPFRRLFRQIFHFAGYHPRSDISSAKDAVALLDGMRDEPSIVLVADLDCSRVDTLLLCHELQSFLRNNPSMASRLRILLLKDFRRPGLNPSEMRSSVQKIARRIFHPVEGALVLVESLYLSGLSETILSARFRNLDNFLYSNRIQSIRSDPDRIYQNAVGRMQALGRSLPFLWLYDLFRDLSSTGSITLQPDVNTGNLFYGIRSPDTAGESLENLDE